MKIKLQYLPFEIKFCERHYPYNFVKYVKIQNSLVGTFPFLTQTLQVGKQEVST